MLNARALRFVELAEYLHRNNWVHFQLQGGGWTEELEGEEKVFGIIIRTLLCNDSESKQFYDDVGKFRCLIANKGIFERIPLSFVMLARYLISYIQK